VNTTTLERPDVRAYLDAVRSCLADLPAEERDDLVADLEASLIETGEAPALPPQEFASELREAAGLHAPAGAERPGPTLHERLAASERLAMIRTHAGELAPMWWLVRAYVAAAGFSLAVGFGWPVGTGVHRDAATAVGTLGVLLAALAVSVWLGLRSRRRPRTARAAIAVDVVLALALVPIAVHSISILRPQTIFESVGQPVQGLALDGVPIRNVYPYDRDGRLLLDVLLYDEFSRPIQVLSAPEDTSRRILFAADGTPVYNSFPVRYFEPGTNVVARPRLAPPVQIPEIETPELPAK
jgi:hypothetical protein